MMYHIFNFTVVSAGFLVVMLSFISDRHIVEGRPSPLDVSQKNQNLKIEDDFLVPAAAQDQDQEALALSVEKENDYFFLPDNFQILDDDDDNSLNDSYFLFNHEPDISSENSKPVTGSDETNIQDILYVLRKLNQNSSLPTLPIGPPIPIRNIDTKNVLPSNNNRSGNGSDSENKYGDGGENSTSLSSGIDMDSSNIFWTNVTILCLLIFVALCLRCYVVERAQRRVEVMVNILEQQIRHSESASASSSGVNTSLIPPTTSDTDDKDFDSTAFTLNPDDEDDDQEELPSYNQAMGIRTF